MKTLFFVRHAKSSWADSSLSDIDRPLNDRGLRDAPFMAQLLKGKSIVPDQIITSPANRAFTTSTYFAEALGVKKEEIKVDTRIYEAWPEDILSLVRMLDNDLHTVILFGHNPTLTSLANMFSRTYIPNVPTCGIVKIEAKIDSWTLLNREVAEMSAFYYPKQYF